MKGLIKETVIHILIGIILFGFVFFAVVLATKDIQEDISQIRKDINEIAEQLEYDLKD